MVKHLISVLLLSSFCFADVGSSDIEFQNSTIRFRAVKNKTKFQFSDNLGSREIEIKDCNRGLVEKFWKDMVKNVKALQGPQIPKGKNPASNAWVKYEGLQFGVLDFEPSMKFFNKVPNNSHVLFTESRRLCRGK